MAASAPLHATLIAARRNGRWVGALLRGASGAGKSSLALRALDWGWRLVADDRVTVWTSGDRLYGASHPRLAGLIEVRGLGVVVHPALQFARVEVAVDADTTPGDRIPEPACAVVEGVSLPLVRLRFGEPGAVARLDLGLDAALRRRRLL